MDSKEEVRSFVRITILHLLRMNEIEEAFEAEEAYQKLYPNSYAYFPMLEHTKQLYYD